MASFFFSDWLLESALKKHLKLADIICTKKGCFILCGELGSYSKSFFFERTPKLAANSHFPKSINHFETKHADPENKHFAGLTSFLKFFRKKKPTLADLLKKNKVFWSFFLNHKLSWVEKRSYISKTKGASRTLVNPLFSLKNSPFLCIALTPTNVFTTIFRKRKWFFLPENPMDSTRQHLVILTQTFGNFFKFCCQKPFLVFTKWRMEPFQR